MKQSILWALLGTGFTFLMTSLGAALVFFFRGSVRPGVQRIFLGFAAGVMIAASVWSLLVPAIEAAEEAGQIGWLPAAGGFLLGVGFLLLMDRLLPHLHPGSSAPEGSSSSWSWPLPFTTSRKAWQWACPLPWPPNSWLLGMKRSFIPLLWCWPWVSAFRISPRGQPFPSPCGRRAFPPGAPSFLVAYPVSWSRFSGCWLS